MAKIGTDTTYTTWWANLEPSDSTFKLISNRTNYFCFLLKDWGLNIEDCILRIEDWISRIEDWYLSLPFSPSVTSERLTWVCPLDGVIMQYCSCFPSNQENHLHCKIKSKESLFLLPKYMNTGSWPPSDEIDSCKKLSLVALLNGFQCKYPTIDLLPKVFIWHSAIQRQIGLS